MARRVTLLRRLASPFIRRGAAFGRDERAAVAVEFGILALPFFTIIYATLETSIVFMAGQILESAVQDSSRLIRTGQGQDFGVEGYREAICSRLYGLFDCDPENDRLRVRVTVVDSFANATVTRPIPETCTPEAGEAGCAWAIEEAYDGGEGSSIVLVEAHYKWPTIVNLPWFNLATQMSNARLLSAVRVFANEPF